MLRGKAAASGGKRSRSLGESGLLAALVPLRSGIVGHDTLVRQLPDLCRATACLRIGLNNAAAIERPGVAEGYAEARQRERSLRPSGSEGVLRGGSVGQG